MTFTLSHILAMSVLTLIGCTFSTRAHAQQERIVVVNGGSYETTPPFRDFVTVGYLDFATHSQVLVDTIDAQSVTDAVVFGDTLFVCTDTRIRSYKMPEMEVVATSPQVAGMRKLARYGNKLFVTRASGTPAGGTRLLGFQANTLSVLDSVTNVQGELEYVLIDGDVLYAGNTVNFSSDTGAVVQVDIPSNTLTHIIHLDTLGQGISKLIKSGDFIYALCTRGYMAPHGALARFQSTGQASITALPYSVGYTINGSAGMFYGQLGGFGLAVATSDFSQLQASPRFVADTASFLSTAAVLYDESDNSYLVTTTDYFSTGMAYKLSPVGVRQDSVQVGISPEGIAVWRSQVTALEPSNAKVLHIYPNPSKGNLVASELLAAGYDDYVAVNVHGQTHTLTLQGKMLNTSNLAPGIYQLLARGKGQSLTFRFVKE